MANCTFFGHRICPDTIDSCLQEKLAELIIRNGVDTFYIGNHGEFDARARRMLHKLKNIYPHIKIYTVLAYLRDADNGADYGDTVLPEGIEYVPPRFAICFRNKRMIEKSDYVVTYVTNKFSGAYTYTELAKKRGRKVVHLAGCLQRK